MDVRASGTEFRWWFYDEDMGEKWTKWHTVNGPCAACCCDGPKDGEHQEQCVYYDDPDDYLPVFTGHTRFNPLKPAPLARVEWRRNQAGVAGPAPDVTVPPTDPYPEPKLLSE